MMISWSSIFKALALLWLVGLIIGSLFATGGYLGEIGATDVDHIFMKPSSQYWFGTDSLGRNYVLRVLTGSGKSLLIAGQSLIISVLIALIYGGIAGWFGKTLDMICLFILDVWMSLPTTVMASIVALIFIQNQSSVFVVSLMIGVTHWGKMARVIRAEILKIKQLEFIKAARMLGASDLYMLIKHVLPHLRVVIFVTALYQIPSLVLAESFMSFIGLGVQAPETSWGVLLQEGWRTLQLMPHLVLFPALFLFLTILSLNQFIKNRNFN